jgi:hypothetical protein
MNNKINNKMSCDCSNDTNDTNVEEKSKCCDDDCVCEYDDESCECEECDCHDGTLSEESSFDESDHSDDSDGFDTDDEFENTDKSCVLRGKWIYDNSKTIDEMIVALQREIALLTDLKNDGWVLQEEVQDDHAYLSKIVDDVEESTSLCEASTCIS